MKLSSLASPAPSYLRKLEASEFIDVSPTKPSIAWRDSRDQATVTLMGGNVRSALVASSGALHSSTQPDTISRASTSLPGHFPPTIYRRHPYNHHISMLGVPVLSGASQ